MLECIGRINKVSYFTLRLVSSFQARECGNEICLACSRPPDSGLKRDRENKTRGIWRKGSGGGKEAPLSPYLFLAVVVSFAFPTISERLKAADYLDRVAILSTSNGLFYVS